MRDIVLIGAGGHARELTDQIAAIGGFRLLGHLVDPEFGRPGDTVGESSILGSPTWVATHPTTAVVCAVGDSRQRKALVERLAPHSPHYPVLVHPTATVSPSASLGPGTIVMAHAIVSANALLESHVHVNLAATVSHDTSIGHFASLSPGVHIAGWCVVGPGALLGVGAVTRDRVTIGSWSIVGAGAAVVTDLADGIVAVGVPAREIAAQGPSSPPIS